jgi:hypothetical protein
MAVQNDEPATVDPPERRGSDGGSPGPTDQRVPNEQHDHRWSTAKPQLKGYGRVMEPYRGLRPPDWDDGAKAISITGCGDTPAQDPRRADQRVPNGQREDHPRRRRSRSSGGVTMFWNPTAPAALPRLIAVAVTRWRTGEDYQFAGRANGLDAGQVMR